PVTAFGLRLPAALTAERVARRVDQQFARGVMDEVRALLSRGVPPTAHPFSGLVYRQALELLNGVRDEGATPARRATKRVWGRAPNPRLNGQEKPPLAPPPVDLVPQRA